MNRYAPFSRKRLAAGPLLANLPDMEAQYLARRVAALDVMAPEESCKHIAALQSHRATSVPPGDVTKR
jgi:hypothetical protein